MFVFSVLVVLALAAVSSSLELSISSLVREELPRTSAKLDEVEAAACKKITFQDLWLLYVPNTPIFIAVNNEDRQMVIYSRNVPEKNVEGQWGVLSLYWWSAKYQGNHLTRDFYPWVVQPCTGEKASRHLDLVPMQYLPNQAAVRERLISRGNRYFELNQRAVLQDYHGNKFPRVFKDVSWIFSLGRRLPPLWIFIIILVRLSTFPF